MKIKFWGVRGSIAVPGSSTLKYGGNTSCVELSSENKDCIVFDAGTGIRPLGLDIAKRGKPFPEINLLISHTHWDHIQGFPFFVPCYIPGMVIHAKGPVHFSETQSLQSIFDIQMRYDFFPISNEQLAAKIDYETLKETSFQIGSVKIQTQFANHPILSLAYRVTENGRTVVYTGDHEPYQNLFKSDKETPTKEEEDPMFGNIEATVEAANQRFVNFIRGAHVLIVDCQYNPEEYRTSRRGWGHSSWDYCLKWMKEAAIEEMILTHHDPMRTDQALDQMLESVRTEAKVQGLNPDKIHLAEEGREFKI
jgi:phosphoribosyl 1,2-cyclic phosphodiesterase